MAITKKTSQIVSCKIFSDEYTEIKTVVKCIYNI